MQEDKLDRVLEAVVISADKPMSVQQLASYFTPEDVVNTGDIRESLKRLQLEYQDRGFYLTESASGFRFQTQKDYKAWVTRHWEEKPSKYSRALLETLALIVYRQPITRAEIEDIRGVSVSSNIVKTLQERDWVRVVGHKEVPGKPALLGTTRNFLDYFNLKSLDEMPSLQEIQDIDKLYPELDLGDVDQAQAEDVQSAKSLPQEQIDLTDEDVSSTAKENRERTDRVEDESAVLVSESRSDKEEAELAITLDTNVDDCHIPDENLGNHKEPGGTDVGHDKDVVPRQAGEHVQDDLSVDEQEEIPPTTH